MQARLLEITVKHAKNLKNVRHGKVLKMTVYAAVSLNGERSTEKRTNVDENGGTNPIWNHDMQFIVEEAAAQGGRMVLVFRFFCDRTLGDRDVGVVHVSITELLGTIGATREVTRGIVTNSGMRGELTFSYKLGEIYHLLAAQPQPDGGNDHNPRQRQRGGFFGRTTRRVGQAAVSSAFSAGAAAAFDAATGSNDDESGS